MTNIEATYLGLSGPLASKSSGKPYVRLRFRRSDTGKRVSIPFSLEPAALPFFKHAAEQLGANTTGERTIASAFYGVGHGQRVILDEEPTPVYLTSGTPPRILSRYHFVRRLS